MTLFGTKLSKLKKQGNRYFYKGRWWTPNRPIKITPKGKKMAVLACRTLFGSRRAKLIRFEPIQGKHKHKKGLSAWRAAYWAQKMAKPKKQIKLHRRKKTHVKRHRKAA